MMLVQQINKGVIISDGQVALSIYSVTDDFQNGTVFSLTRSNREDDEIKINFKENTFNIFRLVFYQLAVCCQENEQYQNIMSKPNEIEFKKDNLGNGIGGSTVDSLKIINDDSNMIFKFESKTQDPVLVAMVNNSNLVETPLAKMLWNLESVVLTRKALIKRR